VSDLPDLLGNAAIEVQASDNSLNPSSKRKLSAREADDHVKAVPKSSDDFSFQRRSATSSTPLSRANSSRFTRPPSKQPAQSANEQSLTSPQKKDEPVRKVLAPKSTNSPTKVRRVNINDKSAALLEDGAKSSAPRATRPDRRQSIAPLQDPASRDDLPEDQPNHHVINGLDPEDQANDLPPKTPTGLEIFSPTSTEPSVKSDAHPTEMAVTASVEDVLGNAGRASRRARAAVSYAEPNLRDKMRRPGKELVTAVEGIDHFKNREASVRADSVDRQTDDGVKKEQLGDDAAWKGLPEAKDEPPSPLSNRVACLSGDMKDTENIAEHRIANPSIDASVSKLSIYDGPNSSPHDSLNAKNSSTTETEVGLTEPKKATLKSRRHSVNSTGLRCSGQDPASSHKVSTERQPRPSSAAGHRIEGTSSRPGSATGHRAEGQRPGSAADLRRSASIANESSKPSMAAADLKRSTSVAALNDGSGRMERAASRRRSTMV
jgi:hypothetical protein